MPAASDRQGEPPALPARFWPLGVLLASLGFGVALLTIVVAVWVTLPPATQEGFTWSQRATVAGMIVVGGVVAHAMCRCRVVADEGGLTVVNGYRSHRYAWAEVVRVTLRPGDPWAVLDLSNGTTRSALGIQGADGARAVRQARQLQALVERHAGVEPPRG